MSSQPGPSTSAVALLPLPQQKVQAALLKDKELVEWLETIYGEKDHWAVARNAPLLAEEIFDELLTCFQSLTVGTKQKLLLTLPYLPFPTIAAWRPTVNKVLEIACRDADDWVEQIANALRQYPDTLTIQSDWDSDDHKHNVEECMKAFLQHYPDGEGKLQLPKSYNYVLDNVIKEEFGEMEPQECHFMLRKKPKSYMFQKDAEKQGEIASKAKLKQVPKAPNEIPVRVRTHQNRVNSKPLSKTIPLPGKKPELTIEEIKARLPSKSLAMMKKSAQPQQKLCQVINDIPPPPAVRRKQEAEAARLKKKKEAEEKKQKAKEEREQKKLSKAPKPRGSVDGGASSSDEQLLSPSSSMKRIAFTKAGGEPPTKKDPAQATSEESRPPTVAELLKEREEFMKKKTQQAETQAKRAAAKLKSQAEKSAEVEISVKSPPKAKTPKVLPPTLQKMKLQPPVLATVGPNTAQESPHQQETQQQVQQKPPQANFSQQSPNNPKQTIVAPQPVRPLPVQLAQHPVAQTSVANYQPQQQAPQKLPQHQQMMWAGQNNVETTQSQNSQQQSQRVQVRLAQPVTKQQTTPQTVPPGWQVHQAGFNQNVNQQQLQQSNCQLQHNQPVQWNQASSSVQLQHQQQQEFNPSTSQQANQVWNQVQQQTRVQQVQNQPQTSTQFVQQHQPQPVRMTTAQLNRAMMQQEMAAQQTFVLQQQQQPQQPQQPQQQHQIIFQNADGTTMPVTVRQFLQHAPVTATEQQFSQPQQQIRQIQQLQHFQPQTQQISQQQFNHSAQQQHVQQMRQQSIQTTHQQPQQQQTLQQPQQQSQQTIQQAHQQPQQMQIVQQSGPNQVQNLPIQHMNEPYTEIIASLQYNPDSEQQRVVTLGVLEQCRELFRVANCLNSDAETFIIAFMSGNAKNPLPQYGSTITLKFSEDYQDHGMPNNMFLKIETYMTLNFENGEWKRLRKSAPVRLPNRIYPTPEKGMFFVT